MIPNAFYELSEAKELAAISFSTLETYIDNIVREKLGGKSEIPADLVEKLNTVEYLLFSICKVISSCSHTDTVGVLKNIIDAMLKLSIEKRLVITQTAPSLIKLYESFSEKKVKSTEDIYATLDRLYYALNPNAYVSDPNTVAILLQAVADNLTA
jgi:hypothetical protein